MAFSGLGGSHKFAYDYHVREAKFNEKLLGLEVSTMRDEA